ncbi:MAG TPA: tetratricopeptide repeat protein [Nitrospiraceae bacterium]|nr:tetratricopeptide repeat protein [Nitrospiraceae bacterium]
MILLPFTLRQLRKTGGKALVLSLCLVLSSCAPRASQLPAILPSDDATHDDPARDAQSRLLQEAYRAFVQERYPTAVLFFRRFVDVARDSPRIAEARWWLGRAYEQLGDYRAAMAQYRVVATGQLSQQVNGPLYEGHALHRLDELRQLHAGQLNGQTGQVALRVTPGQLPSSAGLMAWLQDLVQGGVTTLVVEPAQAPTAGREGLNFEALSRIVAESHRLDLRLWVALNLHQGKGLDLKPGWVTTTVTGAVPGETAMLDIANPDYQLAIEEYVRVLARTGCDGLLLMARPVTGFAGEFSIDSFRGFATSFGMSLSPEQVFAVSQLPEAQAQERAEVYWRWVGWKSFSYAKLVARLRKALRESNPTAMTLVEVHQVTLSAPLQGLEQYGEDLAELAPRTGGSVVVRREGEGGEALLEKLGQQLGTMNRVWMGVPMKVAAIPLSMGELKQSLSEISDSARWNMLILPDSARSVP